MPVKVHLQIDESVLAVIHPPRKLSFALLERTKQNLLEMESDGTLMKEDEHTAWVSFMAFDKCKETNRDSLPTKDSIRICIDSRDWNRALKRPHYPMVTVEQVADRLAEDTTFTTLDASSGYCQLPVDEEISKLLTFSTPWGRYRFTRLPFGISSALEFYQHEMGRLFANIPVEIIVDDFLLHRKYGSDINEKMIAVLDKCREVWLKFNPRKVKLRVRQVTYVGHVFTSEGFKPEPKV